MCGRRLVRNSLCFAALLFGVGALGAGTASAAGLSSQSVGVNVSPVQVTGQLTLPSDLSTASASGLGLVRIEAIQGANLDSRVAVAAAAHLRVYPMMGLATAMTPSAAATAMAQYVTSFAQRYGPGGTFWSENPQLPYEPINSYEIGNEPNIPLDLGRRLHQPSLVRPDRLRPGL